MYSKPITFQLATHYLSRVTLRLESLYQSITEACNETHPMMHYNALKNLMDIIHIIEKPELKSRFLKELLSIQHRLHKMTKHFNNELIDKLPQHILMLSQWVGSFGGHIPHDPFMQNLRLTLSKTQECDVHNPMLLFWLESDPKERQQHFSKWLKHLDKLHLIVTFYLELLRNQAEFHEHILPNGLYQHTLSSAYSCSLILLRMEHALHCVPRLQVNRHAITIRLCNADTMQEIQAKEIKLELAICQV